MVEHFACFDNKYLNYGVTGEQFDVYLSEFISDSKYKIFKFNNIAKKRDFVPLKYGK